MQDGEWVQGKIIDTVCYLFWFFYDLDSTESLQDGEWVQGKISDTEAPAFHDFRIRDPHYFVILFQASILWIPHHFMILNKKRKKKCKIYRNFFPIFVFWPIFFAYLPNRKLLHYYIAVWQNTIWIYIIPETLGETYVNSFS